MKRPPTILWFLAASSAALAISVFAWFGYLAPLFLPNTGDGEFATQSALLPAAWKTYRSGNVWSVGYPQYFDITVEESDHSVTFQPSIDPGTKMYFRVQQQSLSLDAYTIARKAEGYRVPEYVTIANYPAAKYTVGNGHIDYVISYHDGVVIVSSDDFADETLAIMLVTFALNTK